MGLRSRASIILLRVVTRFDIVSDVGQNITKTEISDAFIEALNRSTVFKVDLQNTSVEGMNLVITVSLSNSVYLSLVVMSGELGFGWGKVNGLPLFPILT